MADDLKQRWWI